jgi:hypothetical protein
MQLRKLRYVNQEIIIIILLYARGRYEMCPNFYLVNLKKKRLSRYTGADENNIKTNLIETRGVLDKIKIARDKESSVLL